MNNTSNETPPEFEIVLASRNRGKCAEIDELLSSYGIHVIPVSAFPAVPDIVEDGNSFAENATKKAAETAKHLQRWVLGEDSGLMVDALHGAPGIYSARFAGEPADDEANNAKLLAELAEVPEEQRTARYLCHAAIADPQGRIRLCEEASCRGRIAREPRGRHGFGYDPLFLIPEYHRTFGELPAVVKRHLSHRARALERLAPKLARLLREEYSAGDRSS